MGRHYSSNKRKRKSPTHKIYATAAVLLLAVYVTSMFAAAPLAKYASSASGSSEAEVAMFVVESAATTQDSALKLTSSSTTADYEFTVSNFKDNSIINEVTTNYDVKVTLPSKIAGVGLTLTNGTTSVTGSASTDGTVYTFEKAGTFEAGTSKTDNLKLTFTLTPADAVSGTYSDIAIDVTATQQD